MRGNDRIARSAREFKPSLLSSNVTDAYTVTTSRLNTFSRPGLTFDVTDTGALDGPVVVLLHGFPANRHSYNKVAPLLNEAGFRTLAPDQRGYSDGARPRLRRNYRAVEHQRDVLALIDASGAERVHLVGHDWGGALAWQVALAAPERLLTLTVLSTPHPSAMLRSLVSSNQLLRSFYVLVFQLPWIPEAVLRRHLPALLERMGLDPATAADYGRFMSKRGRLTGGLNWYRGMGLPDKRGSHETVVTVPTTFIWGKKDDALGRHAAELTASFVTAAYRFVELDENHWLPENVPEVVAREIIANAENEK